MSLIIMTENEVTTRIAGFWRRLAKLLKRYVRPFNNRTYLSKLLVQLPDSFFPNYRIVVSPVLVESNRRRTLVSQLNGDDSIESSFSFTDSEPTNAANNNQCCCHCLGLYSPPNTSSTPKRSGSAIELSIIDNNSIPPPPPMPKQEILFRVELRDTAAAAAAAADGPGRRVTIGDLRSVKLKPPAPFEVSKTPNERDLMEVMRRRFAAMHSPSFHQDRSSNDGSFDDSIVAVDSQTHKPWNGGVSVYSVGVV